MGQVTQIQYLICETQQRLYEEVWKMGYSVERFSDAFMLSDFCARSMDAVYSHYQLAIPEEIIDFCGIDMGTIPKTASDVSYACAGWCGFFYRYLVFSSGRPSRQIANVFPFHKLALSYPGLHTVDERLAAEIMIKHLR